MWLIDGRVLPLRVPMTWPTTGSKVGGRVVRMRAWGAGMSRGRRESFERRATWELAATEASPRIARLSDKSAGEQR